MRKLLLLTTILATPCFAADLPLQRKTALVVAVPSPFYIGAWGGAGFSKTQNELTVPGLVSGPVSAYPTGIMPGLTLGYASNASPIYYGAAIDIGYDFSRGSVDNAAVIPGTPLGVNTSVTRKNGLFLDEVLEIGIGASTIAGYVPSNAQPQNWPVPITVPGSVWNNLIFAARGGLAQRNVDLCGNGMDALGNLTTQCASKFINGPLAGAKIKAMLSANTEAFVTADYVWWNSSFTPASATPLFANTVSAKNEILFRAGFGYHF
jgi:hypothetical protein